MPGYPVSLRPLDSSINEFITFSVDDDPYEAPSSIEAEANSSDGGFDDLDITDQQDLSNTAENGDDNQVHPWSFFCIFFYKRRSFALFYGYLNLSPFIFKSFPVPKDWTRDGTDKSSLWNGLDHLAIQPFTDSVNLLILFDLTRR